MVSVCMATHNGEKYIKQQIDSILCQLSDDDELIISDDGSTDRTIEIVKSIIDKRINIFSFQHNKIQNDIAKLITFNFENAIHQSKGDYIFLADQDDVWLSNKVDIILSYLTKYDCVVSDCYITDENLTILYDTRFYKGANITKNRWKALFFPTPYQGSCMAFRRTILNRALPFPSNIQSHDRWIGYISTFFYKYSFVPERLIYYRRHNLNASTAKSTNIISYRIKTRLTYMYELLRLITIFIMDRACSKTPNIRNGKDNSKRQDRRQQT